MSEKSLDRHGRWRSVVVAFRASKEEDKAIEDAVALSGMTKQQYLISRATDREITVEKNPRCYKMLKDKLEEIYQELTRIQSAGECSVEFLETVRFVADVYDRTKE